MAEGLSALFVALLVVVFLPMTNSTCSNPDLYGDFDDDDDNSLGEGISITDMTCPVASQRIQSTNEGRPEASPRIAARHTIQHPILAARKKGKLAVMVLLFAEALCPRFFVLVALASTIVLSSLDLAACRIV